MRLRQIDHVDIVPHTGAVWRVVILTEDGQAFALTDRDLNDDGEQVVGLILGVFTDQGAVVGTCGVEVAQRQPPAARARCPRHVGQHLLHHGLGLAVGIGGLHRQGFVQGFGVDLAVDRR